MKANPPGWRAPRLRTRPCAIETRQSRRGSAGRNPAQRGRRLASSLAEMAGLPGGNAPAGFTHPARANPLGGGVPGLQALRFHPEPRKPALHPDRRDPEAAERLRAALTLAIPAPTQRCRPTGCGRPPQRQTGSSPDHAARIHCRDAHRQKWLTPIHRDGAAVIADVRHIRNRAGPYCTFQSYGPVQAQLPEGNPV